MRFIHAVGSRWRQFRGWIRRPKVIRIVAAVVTPLAALGITALLFGWLPSIVMTVQIVFHEYAHYFTALHMNAKEVWLPFFIPIIIGVIGKTYVDESDQLKHRKISIAGPITGITLAAIWFVLGWFLNIPLLIAAGVIFFIIEILNGFLGADGRRFRAAGRALHQKTTTTGGVILDGQP